MAKRVNDPWQTRTGRTLDLQHKFDSGQRRPRVAHAAYRHVVLCQHLGRIGILHHDAGLADQCYPTLEKQRNSTGSRP